ncbi:MAG: methyl-accepting chemotaxis protein [Fretibacterium sp.]|nr:methyl-accepting chemotaxis protein [Fretibacterium sp.]
MFKNIRIAWKLVLGFGSVLFLFILAVVLSQARIRTVQEGNRFLGKLSDAMLLTGRLERNASTLALSIRGYRHTEDDSYLNEGRKQLEVLKADLSAAKALYRSNPELVSLKGVLEMEEPFEALVKGLEDVGAKTAEKRGNIAALADKGQSLQDNYQKNIDLQYKSVGGELSRLEQLDPDEIERRLARVRLSDHLLFHMTEIRRRYFAGMFHRDVKAMEELYSQMDEMQKNIATLLEETRRPSDRGVLDFAARVTYEYFEVLSKVLANYTELANLYTQLEPFGRELVAKSAAASVEAQEWTKEAAAESERALHFAIWVLRTLTVIAVLMGTAVALCIARLITSPLRRIVLLADRARGGDLTIVREEFQYEGHDELGTLSDSISEMIAAQRNAVRKVISLSTEVSQGADALLGVANRGNDSAVEVQGSVEEVVGLCDSNASALEESNAGTGEMTTAAMTAAQSSSECAEFIVQTTNVSNKAVSMVQSSIRDMESLHGKAQESGKKLSELVGSVGKIGEFVDVITSIANQTNLLALNAAIEAARAGEAGRGFAVVAESVRKLAEESGVAAHQVHDLIKVLQLNAQEAMDASRESEEILEATLQKAEDAKGALADSMQQINNANDRIQNIAAVAEEQAAATREIATGIDLVTRSNLDVVHRMGAIRTSAENSAQVSEDVTEQAEKMNSLAEQLIQSLSGFKVGSRGVALEKQ